ncbi:hypothetical protein LIER_28587 [Lithospermum erythrorhizon]|uniref:Uncharacterized protein n=1 Tax=Lithospermum erythrorhizon TaxID=34254 RepID=A0AAV3RM47_LITER
MMWCRNTSKWTFISNFTNEFISSTTADEPETPTTVSVPPIPSGTESKTVPATNVSTFRGTIISSSSFTISMLALFLSGCASVMINA